MGQRGRSQGSTFEEALQKRIEEIGKSDLADEERVILTVQALEREVNNGGFQQFFFNTKEHVPFIVSALEKIGSPETAQITREAIDSLKISGLVTEAAIDQALEEDNDYRDDTLEECDNKYYGTAGDLSGPLLEYIKKNRARIRLP